MKNKKCPECGEPFTPEANTQEVCSTSCYLDAKFGKPKPLREVVIDAYEKSEYKSIYELSQEAKVAHTAVKNFLEREGGMTYGKLQLLCDTLNIRHITH